MEHKDQVEVDVKSRTNLYFAVGCVNLLYVCCGCVASWTSPVIPKLLDLCITIDQATWVGSLYSFGAAFGPIITALCLNTIGRKATLYILSTCFLISWIILSASTEIYVLYLGRIIGGLGLGGTFATASLFIAEIADVKSRGAVNSTSISSLALGILIEFCVGPYTTYLTLVIVSAIPVILFYILFFFIPESPYYLILKNKKVEALQSLIWYRGGIQSNIAEQEMSDIQKNIEERKEFKGGFRLLFQSGPIKALFISFYLLIIQQGCGNNAIITFAEPIFEMGHVAISGSMVAIIGGFTTFLAGIPTPFIVNRFSMKKTLLVSSYGVAFSLGLLALYFYLESSKYDVSKISFLPVLLYILYNMFICWGCAPLPWAIVSELFPIDIKGLATCLCGIVSSLAGFAVIQITAVVLYGSGPTIMFTSFCIFVLITITGSIFIIPDTSGLSLQEVQDYLATSIRPKKSEQKPS